MDQSLCRGAGLGLRPAHLREVCLEQPDVPWFEVHICNYLGGGLNRALLHQVAESYPLSFHGVNLNLGGVDPLDRAYLQKLKRAVDDFQPALISEHACFTAHGGHHFHDLLPVPYTGEAVKHMASRIRQVQDALGRRILIENARRKKNIRHGGGCRRIDFDEALLIEDGDAANDDLIALDEALEKLSKKDKKKADLVQLRYFAGLTSDQAAKILGISPTTADRYWAYARSWLCLEMTKTE